MSQSYRVDQLNLLNSRPSPAARIAMVSLPVPPGATGMATIGHLPTQVQPVGWWPASVTGRKGAVRRQLMFALSEEPIPAELPLVRRRPAEGPFAGPEVSCRIVSKKNTGVVLSEVNEACIRFGSETLGLRMGLRHAGELKWWEWVRIEELWSGPLCKAVRMGGFIEVEHFGDDYLATLENEIQSRALHYHNWLRGEVFALLFANGVVRLTCRHINNHLFDHGRDLEDTVPVIGLTCGGAPRLSETLDGSRTRFELGSVSLNLDETAAFVSPEHPGSLATEDDLLVYQPYDGVEIEGDTHQRERKDGYIVRASERKVPKGVARTVRFTLGMGQAGPEIVRLVVPDWWYALAGEFWPDRVLPVRDRLDSVLEQMADGVREAAKNRPRGFDNGILTRRDWEGEIPYSQMLYAYRSGDLDCLDFAVQDAYHVADIGFDHATETMRMHGYPFGAIAPPLYRTGGLTIAYLETGDPYLLECAESAAVRFYWIDRHNWPRRSYGRDAASVRSLVFLWDYTGKEDYLAMAREALGRAIQCQRPDGSYADQGGAVGGCGAACNEIIKTWMAMLASDAMVDCLLRRPDDERLLKAVVQTGEFLLRTQLCDEGCYTWAYQYAYGDNPGDPREMMRNPDGFERHPAGRIGVTAEPRFLTFLTERTGDTRYVEAWQRFRDTCWAAGKRVPRRIGYGNHRAVQHMLYAQAHQWSARLEDGRIHIRPLLTDWAPSIEGMISTPFGPLKVQCRREQQRIVMQTQCECDLELLVDLPGRAEPVRMSSNERRVFE